MENEFAKSQIYAYTLIGLLVLALFAPSVALSQQETQYTVNKKAARFFEQAEASFINGNYAFAEKSLLQALNQDPKFAKAWLMLGELKLETDRPDEAVAAFLNVIKSDSYHYPMVFAILGKLYYEKGRYDSAVFYYNNSLENDGIKDEMKTAIASRFQAAKVALNLSQKPWFLTLHNIGSSINTGDDEYINSLRLDGDQLLFTRKLNSNNSKVHAVERFFTSKPDNQDGWQKAAELDFKWPNIGNMGAVAFSADGKTLIFAGCGWNIGFGSCDLYLSNYLNGLWSLPMNLGERINTASWESQPSLSADGKTLYFVSNRAGGFGGSDIYKSFLLDDGSWSQPINLGAEINTSANEMSPYIHADAQTLYFSSEGHPGLGKSDLFLSRKDAVDKWNKPVNLGVPINTSEEEINIIVSTDGTTAMFSAKKDDGFGGFDIYQFELPEPLRPHPMVYVKAVVVDAVSKHPVEASFKLFDLEAAQLISEGEIHADDGLLLTALKSNLSYAIHVQKDGYLFYSQSFSPYLNENMNHYELLILLEPIAHRTEMILRNVFFEWDQAALKATSYLELNELVSFLKDNPDLKVELGGHTDNTGVESYNRKLSMERAFAVKSYLEKMGIPSQRIQAKGYGSSNPEAANDTEKGRSLNRRTTLKIIP